MMATSFRHHLADRLTVVQIIRRIFARSPMFRDALISDPRITADGEAILEVSFEHGPPAFRVVAPSAEEAYAILHELASTMVEIERGRHAWSEYTRDDHEAVWAEARD
jgi:UV-stimulated scaffold protein A